MKNLFTAIILALGSSNCVCLYLKLFEILLGKYVAQGCRRVSQEAWIKLNCPISSPTGTHGRRSVGAGGPSSPAHLCNSERWQNTSHLGIILPAPYAGSTETQKRYIASPYTSVKVFYKQQNVLDSFIHSTNIYWEHQLYTLEYARQREFSVCCCSYNPPHVELVIPGGWSDPSVPSSVIHLIFLALHRHLPPGGNMSFFFSLRAVRLSWNTYISL